MFQQHLQNPARMVFVMLATVMAFVLAPVISAQQQNFVTGQAGTGSAQLGGSLAWTYTVTNPTNAALSNVNVTFEFPAGVTVNSSNATAGSISGNAPSVTYTNPSLAPGATVNITINTRIANNFQGSLVSAVSTFSADGVAPQRMMTQAVIVASLPATGETPWWRTPLLLTMGTGALMLMGAGAWALRRRQQSLLPA